MRTRHARQIRYGIIIARMAPALGARVLFEGRHPQLTRDAYKRESNNVLRRILRYCISPDELQVSVDLTGVIQ